MLGANCGHQRCDFIHAVEAIDGLLHVRIKILYAHAHAVETQAAQVRDPGGSHTARVDFDGELAAVVICQMEVAPGLCHQFLHLGIRDIGGGAAAPVQLAHRAARVHMLRLQRDFAVQHLQVVGCPLPVRSDDLVAGAVVADGVAERDMKIQRQRCTRHVAGLYRFAPQ